MKRNFSSLFAALAAFAVVLSCAKEELSDNTPVLNPEEEVATEITVMATLPDVMTKVAFDPIVEGGKPTGLALTWEEGDKLCVYDEANRENSATLTLAPESIGQKLGIFKGSVGFGASSYYVEVLTEGEVADYATQTQPADGQTAALKYRAYATTDDLTNQLEFVNFTTPLAITAKLPSTDVVAAVESVTITASEAIFNGGKTLTVNLGQKGDANSDGILHLYVNLPEENPAIAEGTSLLMKFNTPSSTDHTVYTRYLELGAAEFVAGKLNTINVNASESDVHAGAKGCTGAEGNAYLIGDVYQMQAMKGLLKEETTYFELVDDIDLKDKTWNPICTDPASVKSIIFDGKNHKISNLKVATSNKYASFFGVFKGSLKNVTFVNPDVTSQVAEAGYAGVVAGYVGNTDGTADSEFEYVNVTGAQLKVTGKYATATGILAGIVTRGTISNCKFTGAVTHAGTDAECNVGGVIGQINTGTLNKCSAEVNVTVSSKGRVFGGFIGSSRTQINAIGCSYKGTLKASGGTSYSGLFIGYIAGSKAAFTDCTSEGTFSGADNGNVGLFCGSVRKVSEVKLINCDVNNNATMTMGTSSEGQNYGGLFGGCEVPGLISNCDVNATINIIKNNDYVGGLIGRLTNGAKNFVVEKCSFEGFIGKKENNRSMVGGIIGYNNAEGSIVRNCYTTGEILGANHSVGGIAGSIQKKCTIENCYSTMTITAGHGVGSIVGRANNNTNDKQTSSNTNYEDVIRRCIGWSTTLKTWKTLTITGNHSFAAIVGSTVKGNTLENCYRNPALKITAFGNDYDKLYDQDNANSSNPLVWKYTGDYHCPYHGKAAASDATVSSVAKTLGWSETVWDLSGNLPKLK